MKANDKDVLTEAALQKHLTKWNTKAGSTLPPVAIGDFKRTSGGNIGIEVIVPTTKKYNADSKELGKPHPLAAGNYVIAAGSPTTQTKVIVVPPDLLSKIINKTSKPESSRIRLKIKTGMLLPTKDIARLTTNKPANLQRLEKREGFPRGWSVVLDGGSWDLKYNGETVERYNTEKQACKKGLKLAKTINLSSIEQDEYGNYRYRHEREITKKDYHGASENKIRYYDDYFEKHLLFHWNKKTHRYDLVGTTDVQPDQFEYHNNSGFPLGNEEFLSLVEEETGDKTAYIRDINHALLLTNLLCLKNNIDRKELYKRAYPNEKVPDAFKVYPTSVKRIYSDRFDSSMSGYIIDHNNNHYFMPYNLNIDSIMEELTNENYHSLVNELEKMQKQNKFNAPEIIDSNWIQRMWQPSSAGYLKYVL